MSRKTHVNTRKAEKRLKYTPRHVPSDICRVCKNSKHFCSGSHMHERLDNVWCISAKSSREEEGRANQLLYSGIVFSTPSCCVSISFGQKYPCLSLVVQESPRGAKHNPKTPDAALRILMFKSQAVTLEVKSQAVQFGTQAEQGLFSFRSTPL